MNNLIALLLVVFVFAVVVVVSVVLRRRPRPINQARFQAKWHDMQKLCASKSTWSQAIVDADKLLDKALKIKRFSGKSMGARLTKAQRVLTDNETVWFGHKLRGKVDANPNVKLKEAEVKRALVGIRQALKDLGALPHGRQSNTK